MSSKYIYSETFFHEGLGKTKTIKAETSWEFETKKKLMLQEWDEQWKKKIEIEQKKQEKIERAKNIDSAIKYAEEQTAEAERIQMALGNILSDAINIELLDIETLKETNVFSDAAPIKDKYPERIREPLRTDEKYNPKLGFFTRISKKKVEASERKNNINYQQDWNAWKEKDEAINQQIEAINNAYSSALSDWKKNKQEFEEKQKKQNDSIDEFREKIEDTDEEALSQYTLLSLENVSIPLDYAVSYVVEYAKENDRIVIDITLPNLEDIPTLKSVSYVKSKNEFKESHYTESQTKKTYDSVIYQLVLQTLKVVFEIGNKYGVFGMTVVNGIVNTIDKTTGKKICPCILSVSVGKDSFNELVLDAIDPKAWFRGARGISAATLTTVTPVAPIAKINKEDSRFIDGYSVVEELDDTSNLAAMDWQDFENLIREVFEEEFNANGGEVKITQASRDGGVDAVVFDPDPIRGGKIVIQAKRYTNVVGVSAVRDLYGTLVNEGAMKGILVTTSHFGNDAFEFAKNKPIQLLDGSNLLSLLEKHGHRAKIDINEAKKILNED